jgi:thiamine biosynthesis lipoprotein
MMPSPKSNNRLKLEATGTLWEIDGAPKKLHPAIKKLITEFENNYSRFKPNSFVSQGLLPPDSPPLIQLYRDLEKKTQGRFTYKIAPLLNILGYPGVSESFDFGAAGKGYLIDLIYQYLVSQKITNFVIDGGGDIRTDRQLKIGLENPLNPEEAIGVAIIKNQALCGSAGNRRVFNNFHHIVDPKLKQSPKDILASWVIADSAMIADALATCLFLVPPETLTGFQFEYALLDAGFRIKLSPCFPGEIFYR